ncbi:MAG: DUF3347 domain-containing protein [Chitinophagaceae bacterium]|nr:DUF3347 domain-containing protein [Chitinophagaceae bacterium]
MKNRYISGLMALFTLFMAACNQNTGNKSEQAKQDDPANVSATPASQQENQAAKKDNFAELFSHYQHLALALSSDDDKEAALASKGILEALPNINTGNFTAEQNSKYDEIIADVKEHAEHIQENIGNIAHQREHLVGLSDDLYDITKTFGSEKTIYKVYCPMYNDGKGAFWLSSIKEIKNPYHGQEMLGCGEIQEELK